MSEIFKEGDRVTYCGTTPELRGMEGTVKIAREGNLYIGVDFDESVTICNRRDRFWRCHVNNLAHVDDTTIEVLYSFEDFLQGGDLNE